MPTSVPVLHRFPYLKFTFFLIFILNYEIKEKPDLYLQYFERDLNFCHECFEQHISNCQKYFNTIEYDTETSPWQNIINLISSKKRVTNFLRYKNKTQTQKIIAKNIKDVKSLAPLPTNLKELKEQFLASTRLDGFQFCPAKSLNKFVEYLKKHSSGHSVLSIWLHLVVNIEPILMPHLESLGYAVPKNFAVCGFSQYQEYAGKSLEYYYNADFELKLLIAKQLLEAAINFSEGFDGYRFYITDINADNIVFNEQTKKMYFVDLDTVLIVDSNARQLEANSTHKHTYIYCDNCFMYSQADICNNQLSDINLFSACQLLRENLRENREDGFLHPIPITILKAYPSLQSLLDTCVDCADKRCINRFAATLKLIKLINAILENYYIKS